MEKVRQPDDWLGASVVGAADSYVVGVGAGRFRKWIFESSLPSTLRCTLGMGPLEAEQLPDGREERGSEVIWVFDPNVTNPLTPSDVVFGTAYWMEGRSSMPRTTSEVAAENGLDPEAAETEVQGDRSRRWLARSPARPPAARARA